MTATFLIDRHDLRRTAWENRAAPSLAEGEVRFAVRDFPLTSNNITYAAFVEASSTVPSAGGRCRPSTTNRVDVPGTCRSVEALGCYARALRYEELPTLDAGLVSVYVDFSGNVGLRAAVHWRFGDRLTYS